MPVVPTGAGLAPPEEAALCLEEVAPPASGTRKARVLYDYEAADSSELALLADEVGPEGAGKSWTDTESAWGGAVGVRENDYRSEEAVPSLYGPVQPSSAISPREVAALPQLSPGARLTMSRV